ncbi:MAG: ATP-grasp domain-containing protein [Candidatus Omnitrophota bacterium]
MKITGIAVTGVGGGVGQSILKCLAGTPYRVVGVDSLHEATGLYCVEKGYVGKFAGTDQFVERLLDICRKESVNVVFPGLDAELIPLSENKEKFKQQGIEIIVSSTEIVRLADDKYATIKFLEQNGFPSPWAKVSWAGGLSFPVIVKPRFGGARSAGCIKCDDEAELQDALKDNHNYVIQQYIEGEEYTCGTMSWNGKCYGVIPMRRILRDGDTYKAYAEKNDSIIKHVRKVVETLKPCGACNFQLRFKDGQCYIFEINARCSGTTAARAMAGFNEPLWICQALETGVCHDLDFREMAIFRYWNEIAVEMTKIDALRRRGMIDGGQRQVLWRANELMRGGEEHGPRKA